MLPCYNVENWIDKTIESVKNQTHDFLCIVVNDCSTDNTLQLISQQIANDSRFILINNEKNMGVLYNHYTIAHSEYVNDEDVLICLDGDDRLSDENVITRIAGYYESNYLVTIGGMDLVTEIKLDDTIIEARSKYIGSWELTRFFQHIKTFKAFLFRKIELEMFLINGNFYECSGDVAIMKPLIELAGEDRVLFTNECNYIYNTNNPISDFRIKSKLQQEMNQHISKKPKYERFDC